MKVERPRNAQYVRGQLRKAEIALQDLRLTLQCVAKWLETSRLVIHEVGKPIDPSRDALVSTAVIAYTRVFDGYASFDPDRFASLALGTPSRRTHEAAHRFRDKLVAHTDVGESGKKIRFEQVGESIQTFISHNAVSQVIYDGLEHTAKAVWQELREYREDLKIAINEYGHSVHNCDKCEDRREVTVPCDPPSRIADDELVPCPDCSASD